MRLVRILDKNGLEALWYPNHEIWLYTINENYSCFVAKQINLDLTYVYPVKFVDERFYMFTYRGTWSDWTGLNEDYLVAISLDYLYVEDIWGPIRRYLYHARLDPNCAFLDEHEKSMFLAFLKNLTTRYLPQNVFDFKVEQWNEELNRGEMCHQEK